MLNAKDLSNDYYHWLKNNQKFSQLESNIVRIDVPFTDGFEDEIVIYAVLQPDGTIRLTDDGWTLNQLESRRSGLAHSANHRKLLQHQLVAYGVSNHDGELTVNTDQQHFSATKHRFLQAILFVNDLLKLNSGPRTHNLFLEEVDSYFETNNIRTSKNISYVGHSGLTHKYEFAIPGIKTIPARLVKTMNGANNSMFAKSILTDVEQTKSVLVDPTEFYVFLNDQKANAEYLKINPDIINLFTQNEIKVVRYSNREHYTSEFKR